MDKQEKIVCAAVKVEWYDGYRKRSTNFIGVRYKYIKNDGVYEMFCDDYTFLSEIEGFITSKNRFVDAKEAMEIAIGAHQLAKMQEKTWEILSKLQDEKSVYAEIIEHQNIVMSFLGKELKPEDLY